MFEIRIFKWNEGCCDGVLVCSYSPNPVGKIIFFISLEVIDFAHFIFYILIKVNLLILQILIFLKI